MRVRSTISNQPVGGICEPVPDFIITDEITILLRDKLGIEATDADKAKLRRIMRNYMADTLRHTESEPVDELAKSIGRIKAGSTELLKSLQGGSQRRRETIRRMLVSGSVGNGKMAGHVFDSIQVSLIGLSRTCGNALSELNSIDGNQVGAYGSSWKLFVPDLACWIKELGGEIKLPRNDTDKTSGEYDATPFLLLVKLLMSTIPSKFSIQYNSPQALSKRIRDALPRRGAKN